MGGRLIGDPVLVVVFGVFLYGGWRTNRRYLDTCAAIARGIRLRYERAPMRLVLVLSAAKTPGVPEPYGPADRLEVAVSGWR